MQLPLERGGVKRVVGQPRLGAVHVPVQGRAEVVVEREHEGRRDRPHRRGRGGAHAAAAAARSIVPYRTNGSKRSTAVRSSSRIPRTGGGASRARANARATTALRALSRASPHVASSRSSAPSATSARRYVSRRAC